MANLLLILRKNMSPSTFQSGQYCQAQSSCHAYLYPKKMFQLLRSAYSTISIQDAVLFLGMNEDEATTYVLQQRWIAEAASRMLTVKKRRMFPVICRA
ncbi:unnamed protein product [Prunus brigantina]